MVARVSLSCSNLYLYLLSSASFPNAPLLSSPSSPGARGGHGDRQASSASIFLTFPSVVVWLSLPHPNLLSRGLATLGSLGLLSRLAWTPAGSFPYCSFGNMFPKSWKVEGWKACWEVVERACCWGNLRHLSSLRAEAEKTASCVVPISPGEQVHRCAECKLS